jgi:tRNA threonylcarbamoyl adenosine modification protein YeaZ
VILILAIDCATAKTGLAIIKDGEATAEVCWMTKHNQTVEMYPRLDALMKGAGLTFADLDAIAVTRGPGSYNGVRVGMAAAKGLAFALNKPLIGVSTLEAEARRFKDIARPVAAILPLGHDYAVAVFDFVDGEWTRTVGEQAMTTEEVLKTLPPKSILTGDLPDRLLLALRDSSPNIDIICEAEISRAAALGRIALERLSRGEQDTAASLQALYLRRPQVTPPKVPRDMSGVAGRGVIWDLDGVIIDSADLHFQSWRATLAKHGVSMSREQFEQGFGRRNDDIVAGIVNRLISPEEVAAIGREKEAAYRRMVIGHARFFPGVLELMSSLKEGGFKQAVASSAPADNLALVIREMKLEPFIWATVDASQVAKGKPDPEVFVKTAEKLGLQPQGCIVIEDAVAGVEAARRAGMAVIAVTNTHPKEKLVAADLVLSSLEEIEPSQVLELINSQMEKTAQ